MTVKETWVESEQLARLGIDRKCVRYTERIRDEREVRGLLTGYLDNYIFVGIGVKGKEVRTFYAGCMRHEELEPVIAEEMGGQPDEICWGQIHLDTEQKEIMLELKF